MADFPSENGDPAVPDFPSENGEVIAMKNPCAEVLDTSFLMVYYLSPRYVTDDLYKLFIEDDELFELAIIHHDNVIKMRPATFQRNFNIGSISASGYIIIK